MTITERPSHSRFRLLLMFGFLTLFGAGLGFYVDYRSPLKTWRRAIHGPSPAREDHWVELRRDHLILGLDRESTIDEVFALMDDPDGEVQRWAIASLPSVDPAPRDAIPRLSAKLKSAVTAIRAGAATALGEVVRRGESGREGAIAALTPCLADPEPEVRRASVVALGEVIFRGGTSLDPLRSGRPDDPALDLIAGRLQDGELAVRVEASYVLACNDRGEEAVPMLAKFVREQPKPAPLTYPAERAIFSLMVLAARSDEAVATLISELAVARDGYPDRPRDALAWAARQSSPSRARVRRQTAGALKSDDASLRHNAAILMGEIGAGGSAIPELLDALSDPSIEVRLKAIDALGDIGDIDPAIIPALELAAKDQDREIRQRASQALETIDMDDMP